MSKLILINGLMTMTMAYDGHVAGLMTFFQGSQDSSVSPASTVQAQGFPEMGECNILQPSELNGDLTSQEGKFQGMHMDLPWHLQLCIDID